MSSKRTSPAHAPFLFSLAAGLLFAIGPLAYAQTTALPANRSDDETIVLSPFTVRTDRDTGYQATDTLAGTRIRTDLRDVAASISVVTKDLLDDIGAKNAADLLVYTSGTEVTGVAGNFSGSTQDIGFQNFHGARSGVNPTNRVRGLAAADLTRNYFGSIVPMDAYNTQSVTINRGANAILFGLGSPAGIIETSTILPQFRNRTEIEMRVGSYERHRQSLDLERVLWKKKISLRIAALNDAGRFEQEPAMRNQLRLYAAAEARPFKGLSLRFNGEAGRLNQRLPHVDPPVDAISSWFQFGKPDRVDNIFNIPASRPDFETNTNRNGPPGAWFTQPGIIFYEPGDTVPRDAFPTFADGREGSQTIQYRFLAPRDSRGVASYIPPFDPLGNFKVARQILDRSAFDYRQQMIEGPNSGVTNRFKNANFAVEQIFFDGIAGLEFVRNFDANQTARGDVTAAVQSYEITVDINRLTNYGAPNPNFGRPFFAGVGNSAKSENEGSSDRATGFVKWDFERRGFGPSWLRRTLGRHTVTGFYSNSENKGFVMSGHYAVVAPTWRNSVGATDIGNRQIPTVVYLGRSLANATSIAGAGISGMTASKRLPSEMTIWTIVQGTNTWVQQKHNVYQYPDMQWIVNSVTASRNETEARGSVWQGSWASGLLVSTLGWRRDAVDVFSGNNNNTLDPVTGARPIFRPPVAQGLSAERELTSGGIALHVPSRWSERLPARPQLSLYFNESDNFQTTGFRRTVLGNAIAPQEGTTKEFGIGLAAFGGKLSLRVTKYETVQDNMSDSRLSGVLSAIANIEERIVENNTVGAIATSGYVGFDHPDASPLFKQYLRLHNFRVEGSNSDGTRAASYSGMGGEAEVTSTVSKGLELEAVYNPTSNWRIMLNAAKQAAVRGQIGSDLTLIIKDREKEWAKPAVLRLLGGPIVSQTVESWVTQNIMIPYQRALLSVGQPAAELRKWRFNGITNYTFPRNSRLSGWSVGGAARWQDRSAIGFAVINHPTLGLVEDPTKPFYGPTELALDGWIAYRRRVMNNRVDWRVQLNLRNLLNENLLIPVKANPIAIGETQRYEVGAYRTGEERTWELSTRFAF